MPIIQDYVIPGTTRDSVFGDSIVPTNMHAIDASKKIMAASTACKTQVPVLGHNFRPLPRGVENTYINLLSFENLLKGYPNKDHVDYVLHGLRNGFDLGFHGNVSNQHSKNNKSARDNDKLVTVAIEKEIERGHTAGPFPAPPFPQCQVSPIGAAPKPDGTVRLVLDLSQPTGESINDFIDKEEFPCSYTHFDVATELVYKTGRGCYLTKIDIKHAYRLLPVRPEDWPLLVYHWKGAYYVDVKLPFGGRSSASIFTSFADLVCWILNEKFQLVVIHYSDDFLMITRADIIIAHMQVNKLKKAFHILNIPVALDKLIGPSKRLPYLGIEVDTMKFTLHIPQEKVNELLEKMPRWCGRRTCTLRELQSLNGKLQFFSKVIRPGRMFARRLIDLTKSVNNPNHHVTMNRGARDDIHWWCELLQKFNSSSFIPDPKRVYSTDLLLFTDAAKHLGFGAIYGYAWIQAKWPKKLEEESIDFQELFAIVAAVYTWGHNWKGKRVVIVTDNKPITQIWDAGSTPTPTLMSLTRKLYLFAAFHHFSISLKHVLGHYNPVADALSRFQMSRFRRLVPDAEPDPTKLPPDVWSLGNHIDRYRVSDD